MSAALLPELPDATVAVEVAWGADPTSLDGSGWTWADVTADVRADPGISWRLGRADEASRANPAELTVTLDNTTGAYSLGGRSSNWPNVRRNTPVRVRIDPGDGNGARVMFLGFATGWTPSWDSLTGKVAVVELAASGTLRRLGQGAENVVSPMRRFLTAYPNTVAYWPCEEGKDATQFGSGLTGGAPMSFTGSPKLGADSDFASSLPIPTLGDSAWTGPVSAYTPPADFSTTLRILTVYPDTSSAPTSGFAQIAKFYMSGGTAGSYVFYYGTGGDLGVRAFDPSGVLLGDGAASFSIDGFKGLTSVRVYVSGGTVYAGVSVLPLGGSSLGVDVALFAGTLGIVRTVDINPYGENPNLSVGHVSVLNAAPDPTDTFNQLNAWSPEEITTVGGRLDRLAAENAIALTYYSGTADDGSPADTAGPQQIDTLVNLIHACEDEERGVLWDGLTAGLAYTTRRRRENADAVVTVDAAAAGLAGPFAPVDDDQRTRNRWSVARSGGSEFVCEDVDGPMGTAAVGVYADSLTVNSAGDDAARLIAGWLVHAGTVQGYRYPTVTLDLRAAPALAAAVTGLYIGARVDVTNLGATFTGAADETVSLTVEGIAHDVGPKNWKVTLSCSAFEVWRVAVLAADTGDNAENLARLDTDGATAAAACSAAATSLSVATASGPLWTTAADDYPLYLDVGGVQVRATACSGAASPQTFTTDPLPQAVPVGTPIAVWNPPVLGL